MKKFMNNAGFTLVELIVVIAILGILAAVAVPAYTGYINKANASADTQVLSAANTAIAAAMTENGLAPTEAKNYLTVEKTTGVDGKKDGCTVTIKAQTGDAVKTKAAEIAKDFDVYYGNAADKAGKVTFKYYDTVADAPITDNGTLAVSE